jgi:plasmid stability protein
MGQVLVPDVDEAVIEALTARAMARGVSLEQEARDVLTQAARPDRRALLAEIDRIRAMTPVPPPDADDPLAEDLIRADRDGAESLPRAMTAILPSQAG